MKRESFVDDVSIVRMVCRCGRIHLKITKTSNLSNIVSVHCIYALRNNTYMYLKTCTVIIYGANEKQRLILNLFSNEDSKIKVNYLLTTDTRLRKRSTHTIFPIPDYQRVFYPVHLCYSQPIVYVR